MHPHQSDYSWSRKDINISTEHPSVEVINEHNEFDVTLVTTNHVIGRNPEETL